MNLYLFKCSVCILYIQTHIYTTVHVTSLVWIHFHRVQAHKYVQTPWYVHTHPGQKQGYKHDQMPVWFYTEVYSHTLRHTLTHSKGSHGSSELTNPLVDEPSGSLVDFFFPVLPCVLLSVLHVLTICPSMKKKTCTPAYSFLKHVFMVVCTVTIAAFCACRTCDLSLWDSVKPLTHAATYFFISTYLGPTVTDTHCTNHQTHGHDNDTQ